MGTLAESSGWVENLTQLETNDAVLGGPNGPANVQAKELGGRTWYVKTKIEAIESEVTAARGGKTSLDARLNQYDAFDPESIAALREVWRSD
jgi:hypothetical protein